MTRTRIAGLALAATLALAGSAHAEDDPRKAQAEPVFTEGLRLHEAGQHEAALAKFERAYALFPSPNALYSMARCEQELGRMVPALRHYREALKNPMLHPKNAELARRFVGELDKEVAHVTVSGPAGARCAVGGDEVTLPQGDALDAAPGEVTAKCTAGGASYEGRATAARGQAVRIDVKSAQASAGAGASGSAAATAGATATTAGEPVTEPPAADRADGGHGFWTTRRTVGLVAGGALVATSAAIGGVFLGKRSGYASDASDIVARTPQPCADAASATCRAFDDASDHFKSAERGAVIAFAAAGVLGVATAVVVLWPDKRGDAASATRVRVVPNGRGIDLVGTF